jgi:photosystem II stability/assembly factor-like uncharacterized protein
MNPSPQFQWRRTNAPVASSRTDDIFFLDPNVGWAVNSNGQILKTSNGGAHWDQQLQLASVYLRCCGFANAQVGWVGTVTQTQRLWSTKDGGASWNQSANIPDVPNAICGLSVVSESVVYASGTNYPNRPAGVIKTIDGGRSWSAIDMSKHANILVDIFFKDALHGWVVGGKADVNKATRANVKAVVLYTQDGGKTWINTVDNLVGTLPKGEWGWKIFFVNESIGYVSLENFSAGAVLKTTDGGQTWTRQPINDQQHNANLEGVGFVDADHGWIGGWGTADFSGGFSSATLDGGQNWTNADEIGRFLNRFRFFHQPKLVGYASGDTVYKYDDSPPAAGVVALSAPAPVPAMRFPIEIPYSATTGDKNLRIDVWDRFGEHVATVLKQETPQAGERVAKWNGRTDSGNSAAPGFYIYRVSTEHLSHSRIVRIVGTP